ncbi:MAG: N-acetyl-gamma-glutamyl-phosphate reductase [Myxococcota bacterium]|nr:N-acetyl-gamma-glutamyl-phosphate reductase [Myxococcota bacterium]
MLSVALVGASGYTGTEALRLILQHPHMALTALSAGRAAGIDIAKTTPAFTGYGLPTPMRFDADLIAERAAYALLGLPHGAAQDATAQLLERGVKVIDMSADHRFSDPALYAQIYAEHAHPTSLAETVYGLPELHRQHIKDTRLVGCPGCYPTSVILAAWPAVRASLVDTDDIVADCKSGVSGAGRNASAGTHYPETAEGLHAYKTLAHRHAPEMSHALGGIKVRFVPHLVPMIRGILATVYIRVPTGTSMEQVRAVYLKAYADEPFVDVLDVGEHPDPRHVRGTNRCHIGLFLDDDLLVVQSAIDNLCKGSSGQAIQCFNLMAGLPETTGLLATAIFP